MKVNETIYVVTGYIPSDDDTPSITTYKLQRLGMKQDKYIWISLEDRGGLGTGTDNFGDDTIEDAFFTFIKMKQNTEILRPIKTDRFEDVLEIREKLLNDLLNSK